MNKFFFTFLAYFLSVNTIQFSRYLVVLNTLSPRFFSHSELIKSCKCKLLLLLLFFQNFSRGRNFYFLLLPLFSNLREFYSLAFLKKRSCFPFCNVYTAWSSRKDGHTRCKQSRKILLKDWREGEGGKRGEKSGGKLNRKTFSTLYLTYYFFFYFQKFSILLIELPNTIKRDRPCTLLSIFYPRFLLMRYDISTSRLEVFLLV